MNIALIGMGNIAFRHFQSLLTLEEDMNLFIYDSYKESYTRAQEYANELGKSNNIKYMNTLSELPEDIFLAIVAIPSNGRREVVEELVNNRVIKNLLLEKVLFQKEEDYYAVNELIKAKKVNTYVNCPRRMYPIYKEIKNMLSNIDYCNINITGGCTWEMGTNVIHMIDLIGFLTEANNYRISTDELVDEVFESKRAGYKNVIGTINGRADHNVTFSITANGEKNMPLMVNIDSDFAKITINENTGDVVMFTNDNNWSLQCRKEKFPYQSELTAKFVKELLEYDNESVSLPNFEEASVEHLALIKSLIIFFEKHGGEKALCPIT